MHQRRSIKKLKTYLLMACIGFDLFEGTLYCAECEDIIYSADFHEVYLREKGRVVGRRQSNTTQTEHRSSKEGGASICRGEM